MNAYEIRAAILDQAQSMLFSEWHRKLDLEMQRDATIDEPTTFIPAPTITEVLVAARELQSFVDGDTVSDREGVVTCVTTTQTHKKKQP